MQNRYFQLFVFGKGYFSVVFIPWWCFYILSFQIYSSILCVLYFDKLCTCIHGMCFQCRYCIMTSRRNVPYSVLPQEDKDEDNVDRRFTYTPKSSRRIPWKSIALALFLLLLGSSLLFLSYFITTGHMEGDSSQVYGLLFLGILAFLPGTLMYVPSVSSFPY